MRDTVGYMKGMIPLGKEDELKSSRTYNKNSDKVIAAIFQSSDIFDARDLLQVRYEMVRSVMVDKTTTAEVSKLYGVSKSMVSRYVQDVKKGGIASLIPEKKGPNDHFKLTSDAQEFIDRFIVEHPMASGKEVADALISETEIVVSKRTVERYLAKKVMRGRH